VAMAQISGLAAAMACGKGAHGGLKKMGWHR
jgi:hypothetical protein